MFWECFLYEFVMFYGCFGNVFWMTLYAPRMPADPFARSVFTRSEVFPLRACKRHANAHTLGGTLGWDPGPQEKGPGPRDPGDPRGARAHGARWGYAGAIPNGRETAVSFCGVGLGWLRVAWGGLGWFRVVWGGCRWFRLVKGGLLRVV